MNPIHLAAERARRKQREERDQITDDIERMCDPNGERRMIVHLKRPDGSRVAVKVEAEHLDRVLALATHDNSIEVAD